MPSTARLDRLCRLRTRLREAAVAELVRRTNRVAAIDGELVTVRGAEDEARRRAAQGGASGAAVVLAWTYADGLARRASALLDARAQASTAAEGARETVRERRRQEEQLARLTARVTLRAEQAAGREGARVLDELALWAHGRTS